jgi:uncharacterized membrane protein YgcG
LKIKIPFPLVLLIVLFAIPIPAAPAKGSYILDQLDWLSADQEANINSIIQRLDHDGPAEIAVVTLDNCGSDKQAFRKSLFDTWGIGHVDDNDGLLVLVCWYGGDSSRRSVEQLYGPELKEILTSNQTGGTIQQYFVPAFQAGKPGEGLVGMVRTYNALLRTSMNPTSSRNSATPVPQDFQGDFEWMLAALLVHLFRINPSWLISGSMIGCVPTEMTEIAGISGMTVTASTAENRMAAGEARRVFKA